MRRIMPERFLTVIAAILAALTFAQPCRSQSPPQTAPTPVETIRVYTGSLDEENYEAQDLGYLYYSLYLVGAWVAGLAALFMLGKLYSSLTLRSIEEADPNGAAGKKEISLRRRYKRLINVAGVYYYISLPVVMFLILAVTTAILYGFYMIGRIPIKLALILVVAAVVTIYKMIRSLFIKIEREDPGRALKSEEA
ncbi:MAG TPA: hypothetical protein VIC84_01800, partial [Blastocatellia bacterium]